MSTIPSMSPGLKHGTLVLMECTRALVGVGLGYLMLTTNRASSIMDTDVGSIKPPVNTLVFEDMLEPEEFLSRNGSFSQRASPRSTYHAVRKDIFQ